MQFKRKRTTSRKTFKRRTVRPKSFKRKGKRARFKRLRTNRDVPKVYIRIGPPGTRKSRWLDEQYGLDKWIEAPE